jgi:hypothetical protein
MKYCTNVDFTPRIYAVHISKIFQLYVSENFCVINEIKCFETNFF